MCLRWLGRRLPAAGLLVQTLFVAAWLWRRVNLLTSHEVACNGGFSCTSMLAVSFRQQRLSLCCFCGRPVLISRALAVWIASWAATFHFSRLFCFRRFRWRYRQCWWWCGAGSSYQLFLAGFRRCFLGGAQFGGSLTSLSLYETKNLLSTCIWFR